MKSIVNRRDRDLTEIFGGRFFEEGNDELARRTISTVVRSEDVQEHRSTRTDASEIYRSIGVIALPGCHERARVCGSEGTCKEEFCGAGWHQGGQCQEG